MADKVKILKEWIEREGRKQIWVAQQVGCSPQWLNYVLRGKQPLSDRLARTLQDKLGVPLASKARPSRRGRRNRTTEETNKTSR